ncbi:MAG: peptidylprolyl isomerase, partial [Saezia sp.]
MKKTTIALLIGSLFAITACSPSENTKPASTTTTTPTQASSTATPSTTTPATGNVTASANLGPDVLATVNGQPISSKHAQLLIDMTQKANPGAPVDVQALKDNIITQEILAQEARRLEIDQTEDYKIQIEFMSKAFLTNLLYKDFTEKNPVTDAEIQKEYDFIKTQLTQAQEAQGKEHEFQARHILVDNEDKAKEIIAQLNAGGNFADLAKANSIDPGSAQDGGSLGGWTTATVFVP